MTRRPRLRVGVAAAGDPTDAGLWSGTPKNIAVALRADNIDVVPIDVTAVAERRLVDMVATPTLLWTAHRDHWRRQLNHARLVAKESLVLARARSAAGNRILARRGEVDGIVQIGTGYTLRHPNVVSYEDMTVPQAIDSGVYHWARMSKNRRASRTRQQHDAYQRNTGAAFASPWAAQSAVADLACAPEKVHVVGIGPNFAPSGHEQRDWAKPTFLFTGKEWTRKNGERVLRAFREVRATYPEAQLHLAGDHPRIDQDGVTGHGYLSLREPGARKTMLQLWQMATCCVVPSLFEPAGIVYVEAMHAGIPSVGTARGGASSIIGDAGVTVDPEDELALTRAMLRYCKPQEAQPAGERATQRSRLYNWDTVASGLLEALRLGSSRSED